MRKTIEIEDRDTAREMMGVGDSNLRRVKEALGVTIFARNQMLHIEGEDARSVRPLGAFCPFLLMFF